MGLFSMETLALKWSFLFLSGVVVFVEYINLYMKQLGFSPSQIGVTTLFGVLQLLVPFFGFLGDRFRARKLIFTVLTALIFLTTLAALVPLVASFPTCFLTQRATPMNETSHTSNKYLEGAFNRSSNQLLTKEVKRQMIVPWLSALFIYMLISRAFSVSLAHVIISLRNVATITQLSEKRASLGSYTMWEHIGAGVSLFAVGLLASHFTLSICGVIGDGYYIALLWASMSIMLSSFAIPWFKYDYLEHRVMNWTEVKSVFCDLHYVFVLAVAFFLGSCSAFQINWEFWYIDELSGSPTIMGVAGLIRRPLVAVWFYLSGHVIEKVGDLKTTAVALFLFAVSFLAISFINIPWLVLAVDLLQSAGYAFTYTSLNIHFSKPGSKASSAVILGIFNMAFSFGIHGGSGVMGLLFHAIGSKTTLFCYSIASAFILICLLAYINFSKCLDDYEKLPEDRDGEDDD